MPRQGVPLAAAMFAAHAQPSTDSAQIIVVAATRHAMALVDAAAAMTAVTREQIAERTLMSLCGMEF